ncbi:MAG: acetoacetate--CoA ligase [Betaproteobacteria bacterium]|nr:acetoacetate--CoA ligase [Betaproteobacteria bacterium]
MSAGPPLWQPSPGRIASAKLTAFMRYVAQHGGPDCTTYPQLYDWSVSRPADFWSAVWAFCGVIAERGSDRVLEHPGRMPGARWFPDARLNYAENLLKQAGKGDAIVFRGENRVAGRLSHDEMRHEVSRFAQALRAAGIKAGDRIAGYMPNLPGTVIAMLAASSIGAVWSSCSPDFGVQGVVDRFGQIEPRILVAADGYFYNRNTIDNLPRLQEIMDRLPSVERLVVVPYTCATPDLSGLPKAVSVHDFMAPFSAQLLQFERLPFDHPLFILYSSGTTGVPKCIVHGAGGTLLQHLKEHVLHSDIGTGDRLFYFTTCGWMMWNWLVSGLAAGATLMLYDGSPFLAKGAVLWDYAGQEKISAFGTSAKYIDALAKLDLRPGETHDLSSLRALLSTGSPLVPESFDYVYRAIKADLQLASISGGTDIISCFALGCPVLPVFRGELQCRGLGMKVEVWNEQGHPVRGEKGELVCTAPFPSMPTGFWNDPGGKKYRAAYFERFPGAWHHGDYVELTGNDGLIIYGRSDAVLNPGGVRIGTAEIYRQVERLDEVVESIAIGQDWPPQQANDVRVVLFVRLRDGLTLDAALIQRIRQQIRDNTTPRHVPSVIAQVTDIPRTKSGKIVELAVRNVVHGLPVLNVEALANPEALDQYRDRAELRG